MSQQDPLAIPDDMPTQHHITYKQTENFLDPQPTVDVPTAVTFLTYFHLIFLTPQQHLGGWGFPGGNWSGELPWQPPGSGASPIFIDRCITGLDPTFPSSLAVTSNVSRFFSYNNVAAESSGHPRRYPTLGSHYLEINRKLFGSINRCPPLYPEIFSAYLNLSLPFTAAVLVQILSGCSLLSLPLFSLHHY